MKSFFLKLLLVTSLVYTFVGCTPFKPSERTTLENELPQTYSNHIIETTIRERWWEEFNDPELNALVEEALGGNLTLKESWARLRQARALAVITGAARFPDLSVDADASAGRQRTKNGQTETKGVEQYTLGLLSNYELDLWGRIRSEHEASLLSASATREDVTTVAMTLAATVTERWTGILSQRMQKKLLEQQLATNLILLELLELRFDNALSSALDVLQQRQVVESSRSQIPLVEEREQLLLHDLALLLGEFPQSAPVIKRQSFELPRDLPETGLPAQLLTGRPDVRAAILRLQSADWQVSAAQADRLPSIRLTGRAGYSDGSIDLLLNNWFLGLAANLTAPIFDAGKRAEEVERRRAVVTEKLAVYRRTIITAVKEVEDALVKEQKLHEHIERLEVQLGAAQKSLKEAGFRYRNGLNDYLRVLSELVAVQNLERDLIQRKAELLVARVNLYRALGGTWTGEPLPKTMEDEPETRGIDER